MSNILGFAAARKTARAELLAAWLDGGEIRVYSGARPATTDTAVTTQTLLVTFAIPDPSGEVANGVLTGNAIAAALIAETGFATWARAVDSATGAVFDADVGTPGSGALLQLDNLNLVQGGYCTVTSFTVTER